ncbi:DUF3302 domain-containing protein [Bradyrhizobium sp. CNPSo 4016]|nr:DUF3302 domain-containing protein [Bradyrhizobium glycinis]
MSALDILAWIALGMLVAVIALVVWLMGSTPGHVARRRGHRRAQAVRDAQDDHDRPLRRPRRAGRRRICAAAARRRNRHGRNIHRPRQAQPCHSPGTAEAGRNSRLRKSVMSR